jgi:hypothetical protein
MTPFGTHRDDPVLAGITDHNGGYARSRLKLLVTLRDLLAGTDLLLTVGPDSLW